MYSGEIYYPIKKLFYNRKILTYQKFANTAEKNIKTGTFHVSLAIHQLVPIEQHQMFTDLSSFHVSLAIHQRVPIEQHQMFTDLSSFHVPLAIHQLVPIEQHKMFTDLSSFHVPLDIHQRVLIEHQMFTDLSLHRLIGLGSFQILSTGSRCFPQQTMDDKDENKTFLHYSTLTLHRSCS